MLASGDVDLRCVELELRLGKCRHGGPFKASVSGADYDALLGTLTARTDEFSVESSDSLLFYYDAAQFGLSDGGNVRVHWDAAAGAIVGVDRKKLVQHFDAELSHLPYDLRVAVAHEYDVPGVELGATELPPAHKSERQRMRHSFSECNTGEREPLWRIDITKVAAADESGAVETTFEVEIELIDCRTTLARWLATEDGGDAAMLSGLSQLWTLLGTLLGQVRAGSGSSTSFPDVPLERVREESELDSLRKTAVEWVPNFQNEASFPGPMPAAFSRRHFAMVQSNDYMVSEKSDGLRYMMLVNSSGVYLFDRLFDFYLVSGCDVLTTLLASNEVTVLDGELVRHQKSKRPMYLIFDAVVIDGSPVGNKKLTERLEAVRDKVIVPYRAAMDDGRLDEATLPFTMLGKAFHKKAAIGQLFSQSIKRSEGGDRIFSDSRRCHKTDGIIFTPVNSSYRPTTAAPILKWKFLDKQSVDLKLRFDQRHERWMLYCTGDRGSEIELRALDLSAADTAKISDDMRTNQHRTDDGGVVIELSYDVWGGRWHYQTIRADKQVGNNVRTVFDTLEVIAENVTEQELCYRLPRAPGDDRWQQRITEAMTRMNHTAAASSSSSSSTGAGSVPRRPSAQPPQQQRSSQQAQQAQQQQQQQRQEPDMF